MVLCNQRFVIGSSNLALSMMREITLKPGLHEPQLPVERSVTLVSSVVIERRRCALQVVSVLDYKRIKKRDAPLN